MLRDTRHKKTTTEERLYQSEQNVESKVLYLKCQWVRSMLCNVWNDSWKVYIPQWNMPWSRSHSHSMCHRSTLHFSTHEFITTPTKIACQWNQCVCEYLFSSRIARFISFLLFFRREENNRLAFICLLVFSSLFSSINSIHKRAPL